MIKINNAVTNAGGNPMMLQGLAADIPVFGVVGRIYITTDTEQIFRDTGTSWQVLANGGGANDLQAVTNNGNETTNDIRAINSGFVMVGGSLVYSDDAEEFAQSLTLDPSSPLAESFVNYMPLNSGRLALEANVATVPVTDFAIIATVFSGSFNVAFDNFVYYLQNGFLYANYRFTIDTVSGENQLTFSINLPYETTQNFDNGCAVGGNGTGSIFSCAIVNPYLPTSLAFNISNSSYQTGTYSGSLSYQIA